MRDLYTTILTSLLLSSIGQLRLWIMSSKDTDDEACFDEKNTWATPISNPNPNPNSISISISHSSESLGSNTEEFKRNNKRKKNNIFIRDDNSTISGYENSDVDLNQVADEIDCFDNVGDSVDCFVNDIDTISCIIIISTGNKILFFFCLIISCYFNILNN